jgi:maltose alpha-D-glucosyltransferase/alpha-amylase
MLRSFDYATEAALAEETARGMVEEGSEVADDLAAWGRAWCDWVSSAFLGAYLETAGEAAWIPADDDELALLLETSLLEKAVYELGYELNNRPDWVGIPLRGIRDILDAQAQT